MSSVTMPRWTLVAIVASLIAALSFALGGVYSARGENHDTTYYACLYAGALSQVGTTEPINCGRGAPISWNAAGPQGEQGPEGPEGPPATALWAIVDGSDGDLIAGSGVVETSRVDAGEYQVEFESFTRGCALLATTGPFFSVLNPEFGVVTVRAQLPTSGGTPLRVWTWDAEGELADRTFNLAVFC